ncbi:MAG: hypothetical protein K8F92_15655 [Hyphomicrobium sp.]|uniref:hypothetical protein n=1 Tax=Hyphomicrobium sp. TaxID=82 RepID=UPI001329D557|nr:hypothetical protein [Hyphomicrobium sp.]KAB2938017.1 MAG: hypothetical protein F9K20_19380 [Hyphomicrobium sp.]MBZ0211066.1 hypothetical protein [Hyphomicrobium sp.]MCZ7594263.1 hypothetical protein [Hyphomicrobium sp.]
MLSSLDHVFRLRAWTVRSHKGKYYVSTEDHPKSWGRAYKTLRAATTAIARHLEREFVDRARRFS